MNITYVRVSSADQNEERQIKALEVHNIDKWFMEKISGKDTNRPKLQEMLQFVREGDTIYVHDFSRLARSTKDLLNIIEGLDIKNVCLVSNKENIDSSTSMGKLMLTMIGAINEFERINIKERQLEGIEIAKQKGKYKGRKEIQKPSNWDEVIGRWRAREITATDAMQSLGLKRNTFYKMVKTYTNKSL